MSHSSPREETAPAIGPKTGAMINLSSFITFHARRTPERPALKYRGEEISYAVFDARVRKVAGWLAEQAIGAAEVVAVLMKDTPAVPQFASTPHPPRPRFPPST